MVSQVDPDGLITVLPSLSTQEFNRLKSLTNASPTDQTPLVQRRAETSASSLDRQAEAPSAPRAYEEAPAPMASRDQVDDEGVEDRLKGLEDRLKSLLTTTSRRRIDEEGLEDRLKGLEDRLKSLQATASRRRDDEGVQDRLKGLEDRLKSLQATPSRRRDDEGVEDRLRGLETRLRSLLTTTSRRRDDEGVEDRLRGLETRLRSLLTTTSRRRDDEGVEDCLRGLEGRLKSLLAGDQTPSLQRRPEASASSPARQSEMSVAQGRDEGAPSPNASRHRVEGEDFKERLLKSAEERFKTLMNTFLGDQTPSLQRRPEASASSSARQAEAPAAQRAYERTPGLNASRHRIEGETTKEERERALLALIQEGRSMLPSKSELMAKVEEIKRKGNKERPSASMKKRGKRGTG